MSIHLEKEVAGLKKRVLALGTLVEENVGSAVRAVGNMDQKIAQAVINSDRDIDMREVEIEEECLKILALHQPVAVDLRFIVAVLKMNNDLERIGDLSVNIAERALGIHDRPPADLAIHLEHMAERARGMLKKSLDSLINMDAELARHVCGSDHEVDLYYRDMYVKVKAGIVASPERLDDLLQVLSISRHIERIADHATNIAEDVIYMIEGEIFRHSKGLKR
jgi:phosphate transport system protein